MAPLLASKFDLFEKVSAVHAAAQELTNFYVRPRMWLRTKDKNIDGTMSSTAARADRKEQQD